MKLLGVDVSQFCRDAIKEKINRDYEILLPKNKPEYCPFSNSTIRLN